MDDSFLGRAKEDVYFVGVRLILLAIYIFFFDISLYIVCKRLIL